MTPLGWRGAVPGPDSAFVVAAIEDACQVVPRLPLELHRYPFADPMLAVLRNLCRTQIAPRMEAAPPAVEAIERAVTALNWIAAAAPSRNDYRRRTIICACGFRDPRSNQHSFPFDRLADMFGGGGEDIARDYHDGLGLIVAHLADRPADYFLPWCLPVTKPIPAAAA